MGTEVIFRYDNAPDPNAKGLNTFPHHKHLKDEKFMESHSIGLSEVLEEIEIIYVKGIEKENY